MCFARRCSALNRLRYCREKLNFTYGSGQTPQVTWSSWVCDHNEPLRTNTLIFQRTRNKKCTGHIRQFSNCPKYVLYEVSDFHLIRANWRTMIIITLITAKHMAHICLVYYCWRQYPCLVSICTRGVRFWISGTNTEALCIGSLCLRFYCRSSHLYSFNPA